VDLINDLEFEGGEQLLHFARPLAERVASLKQRLKEAGVPTIYANDNFGRWRSDFRQTVEHVLEPGIRGRPLAVRLAPEPDDYFILKPKHSAFHSTTLELLLEHLGTRTLIVAGIRADLCVLFTAADAYLRDYRLVVPADCVACVEERENARVLDYLGGVLRADTTASTRLNVQALLAC
jgi:nicotinamidase-related amidase